MADIDDINQQCAAIYVEIEAARRSMNWTVKELCTQCADAKLLEDDLEFDEEREWKERFYQKHKKTLGRKQWERGRAMESTLHQLKEMKRLIALTDKYRKADDGILTAAEREIIEKASENMVRKLKMQDYD